MTHQPLVIRLEVLVLPINALLVIHIDRGDQLIGHVGKQHFPEVHPAERVGFRYLCFAGFRIEHFQPDEVHIGAFVGLDVNALAVLVKLRGAAQFQHVAGVNFCEAVRIDAQNFGITILGRARRQPQLILQIEDPPGNAIRVLAEQRALAGGDAHFVKVVPGLVAIVQAEVDKVRLSSGHVVNECARALDVGQISRRGYFRSRRHAAGRIDYIHVVILVAGLVLHEQDVFAVLRPEKSGNGPFGVVGNRLRLVERLFGAFHPDVSRLVERLQKGDELAVRRQ